MCGRAYSTYTDDEIHFLYLNRKAIKGSDLPFKPNFNMSPTQTAPVVRSIDGARGFDTMRWGLIPEWSPEFSTKLSTINAKSETVFESKLYRKAITQRRCIVPVSGFFEWKKESTGKRPFRIYLREKPIMSLAGIWTTWHAGSPGEERSFSILTTSANEFMSGIHDRMPVILDEKDWSEWLDPEVHEPERIGRMLNPCPPEWLNSTEVSTLVNSPKNNRAEVLEPVPAKSE